MAPAPGDYSPATTINYASPSPVPASYAPSPALAQDDWVPSADELSKDKATFSQLSQGGFLTGEASRYSPENFFSYFLPSGVFSQSGLTPAEVGQICQLADMDRDQRFSFNEFAVAMKMIRKRRNGAPVPPSIPPSLASWVASNSQVFYLKKLFLIFCA